MEVVDILFCGMELDRMELQGAGKSESERIEDTGFRHVVVCGVEGILVTGFMEQGIRRMTVGSKQELAINRTGDHFIGLIGFHHSESA